MESVFDLLDYVYSVDVEGSRSLGAFRRGAPIDWVWNFSHPLKIVPMTPLNPPNDNIISKIALISLAKDTNSELLYLHPNCMLFHSWDLLGVCHLRGFYLHKSEICPAILAPNSTSTLLELLSP